MTAPLALGVHVGQQNATMAELIALWQRLDGAVDWISVWDHLYEAPPAGGTTPHFEAIATLGALASVTSEARLGCLMFCVPYRNPALLAKACVAIDHIAEGRFEPGFGAGWHAPEFRALNDRIDQACEAIGRDPATLERSINLAFHIGATPAEADAELERIRTQWGPELTERLTAGALTGTPDQALDRIAEYREAGADLVNIALRLPVNTDALEAYLTETVPAARSIS